MKNCPKCRCTGRVKRVDEGADGRRVAEYVCPRPGCANYRQVFAEEELPPALPGEEAETGV